MAVSPNIWARRSTRLSLAPFDLRWAETVSTWVRSPGEAYWLAPRTPLPIDAATIRGWSAAPGREPCVLIRGESAEPVAYGELNVLDRGYRSHWLGHLVVAPHARGQGLGRALTELLLARAFEVHESRRVTLVVFRENQSAIACYRKAGMRPDGFEHHFFEPYNRGARLLRMAMNSWRYRSAAGGGQAPTAD